jgi:hypothetical protein
MDRRLTALAAALAAASLMAGCASTAKEKPVSATARTTSVGIDGTIPGRPKSVLKAESGYRVVTRKGEQRYCKRELVTGSRTNASEICLTEEQMEKERNGIAATLRTLQDMNNGRPDDSRYNNVMGPGRRD